MSDKYFCLEKINNKPLPILLQVLYYHSQNKQYNGETIEETIKKTEERKQDVQK